MIAVAEPCAYCSSPSSTKVVLVVHTPAPAPNEPLRMFRHEFHTRITLCPDHRGWVSVRDVAVLMPANICMFAGVSFRALNAHAEIVCEELYKR
jgi:hypothetical protein